MPSTEDPTFQRIQREISEVVQREKELKSMYARSHSTSTLIRNEAVASSNGDNNVVSSNGKADSIQVTYERSHSVSSFNGNKSSADGNRLFRPNTTAKGVMHRFIKSRGKMQNISSSNRSQSTTDVWTASELVEPPKVPIQTGKPPRNGFVPVEERIRREFEEMQLRESELRTERRKSQPDLMAFLDRSSSPPPPQERSSLRSSQSYTHLADLEDYGGTSEPSSLKSARSLAELCDTNEEELTTPSTLIRQWESMIKKNQQQL